ncbi:MAG TPA: YgeY family selenium metabolism-linked hydrolase [Candidatus Korarchaeota archaeon]|nr:YgeY family selenium metabolism-linked hydrolase [Candidatus Korarchaeota archaeon]
MPAEEDLAKFCSKLIQTPSMSGEEKEVAVLIRDEMNSLGFDRTWIDEAGNVAGLLSGSGAGPTIVLEGHMDTVPPGRLEEWKVPPFSGALIDGWIYGRGAADMKGAIASMVYSATKLGEIDSDVYMVFVVHEEDQEGFGIRHFVQREGLRPDLVVIGEATKLNIAVGHRGRVEVRLRAEGRTAHSSMPQLGESALEKMIDALVRLRTLSKEFPEHPVLGRSTVAAVAISCSPGQIPVIPDVCEALLDYRLVPGETLEEVLGRLSSLVAGLHAEVVKRTLRCYTGLEAEVTAYFPAWYQPSTLAQELARTLNADVTVWKFGTDGSYTAGEAGFATVGYGPGDEALAHRPNERVSIRDLELAVAGYSKIVLWAERVLTRGGT